MTEAQYSSNSRYSPNIEPREWAWAQVASQAERLMLLALAELMSADSPRLWVSEAKLLKLISMTGFKRQKAIGALSGMATRGLVDTTKIKHEGFEVRFRIEPVPYPEFVAPERHSPGIVYLMRGESDRYKIGRTADVAERLKAIKTGSPMPVKIIAHRKVPDAPTYERYLHDSYGRQRLQGEWFKLSAAQAGAISLALTGPAVQFGGLAG